MREHLVAGAARSGGDGAKMPIVSLLPTAIGDSKTDACDKLRPGIAGTPDECRAKIQEIRASGIDVPLIAAFAMGPTAQEEIEAVIRACAPEG